jgi:hypothetical protein
MNKFRPQSCEGDHGEGGDQVEEASAGKGPTPAHPAQAVIPGLGALLFRSLFR